MSGIFRDSTAAWAAGLIVLLPLIIIGIGELEERLRQRDSSLRRPISAVRRWVLPIFTIWVLLQVLLDPGQWQPVRRLVGSALVLALGAASLAALDIVTAQIRDRPRTDGRRSVPRLILALPRLLLILTIAWVLIAGVWAVDLSAALTALGVTSLVISFALQDTLGGIASGFTLLADQPFQPGDWIRTGDLEGRVVDVNWRSSRIQTRDGDLVIVPNGQLATATITNYDQPSRLHRVVVPVQVAYVNAPTDAKEMLLAAARSTPGVLTEPPPNAVVVQIDDPLMGYEVHMWVDDHTISPRVRSDFGSLVWYHSHRRGVPLPSPAQDLFLWDGLKSAEGDRRDHASLLRGLRGSTLLDQLDDDELDRLAGGATPARYAAGETILGPDDDDLVLVEHGQAQYALDLDPEGCEPVLDLGPGDIAAAIERGATKGHDLRLLAVGDCEVLILRSGVAGGVISRSPGLNTALEQIGTSRRRRVHRVLRRLEHERQAAMLALPAGSIIPSPDETDQGDGDATASGTTGSAGGNGPDAGATT